MTLTRIDFVTADAAKFNLLRDQWRSVALAFDLNMSGLRLAGILPTFVSREFGYAYPTDDDLATEINKSRETVKRGLNSLDDHRLIERVTRPFRKNGVVVGKQRRIYLTLPAANEGAIPPKGHPASPKGHFDDPPKGHFPKGHDAPKGHNPTTEGTPGVANTLDTTRDEDFALEHTDLSEGTYTGNDPSVVDRSEEKKAQPNSERALLHTGRAFSPAQEQNSYLSAKNGDQAFAPSVKSDPSLKAQPFRWQDAKHPKVLQGRPLSRVPFPAPRTLDAAHAFFRHHHVPKTAWPRLLPDLMDGHLYEYDIEPWMDAA